MANNSKILILDEPTASLSNREVEKLLGVIKVLKGRGISIIFITHSLHDIFRICDRVTVLRDGRVVLVEEVEKLDLKRLVTSMTGTEIDSEKWEKQQDVRTGTPLLELKDVSTSRIRDVSLKVFPGRSWASRLRAADVPSCSRPFTARPAGAGRDLPGQPACAHILPDPGH